MAEGIMYRYVAYMLILIGFYASAVLFLRVMNEKLWQCLLLGVVCVVLINPHGFATVIPHYFW
jgi:hypothetical protein